MGETVTIKLIADDQASSVLKRVGEVALGVFGGNMLTQGMNALAAGLGAIGKQGLAFNDTLERTQISLQASLSTMFRYNDAAGKATKGQEAFAAASGDASVLIDQLQVTALKTAGTFEDMLTAVQGSISVFKNAKIPLGDMVETTQLFQNAMAGLKIPMHQMNMEIKQFFAGDTARGELLKRLGISKEEIEQVQKAGKTVEFLREKLGQFKFAGEAVTKTMSGLAENIGDMLQQLSAKGTKGLFDDIKTSLGEVMDFFVIVDKHGIKFRDSVLMAFLTIGETARAVFGVVKSVIIAVLGAADDKVKTSGHSWTDTFKAFGIMIVEFAGLVGKTFVAIGIAIQSPITAIKTIWTTMVTAMGVMLADLVEKAAGFAKTLDRMFGTNISENLKATAAEIRDFALSFNDGDKGVVRMQEQIKTAFDEIDGKVKTATDSLTFMSLETKKVKSGLDGINKPLKDTDDDIKKATAAFRAFAAEAQRTQSLLNQNDGILEYNRLVQQNADNLKERDDNWARHLANQSNAWNEYCDRLVAKWKESQNAMLRASDNMFGAIFAGGGVDGIKGAWENLAKDMGQIWARSLTDALKDTRFGADFFRGLGGEDPRTTAERNDPNFVGPHQPKSTFGTDLGGVVGGAAAGYSTGAAVGSLSNKSYGQTGAAIGGMIGSIWGPIGALVGAVVGLIVGAILQPNTLKHVIVATGSMISGGRWVQEQSGPRKPDENYDESTRPPAVWKWRVDEPKSDAERAGRTMLDGIQNSLVNVFRMAEPDQARSMITLYRENLRKFLGRASFDINAGSNEDIQKDLDILLKNMLPRLALQAAFGQTGYGPTGNQNSGGVAGISWNLNNPELMDRHGNWVKKQLYDEDAPIPMMLKGLGFTADKIKAIASRLSTDDPQKFLTYLQSLVEVVTVIRELRENFGKTASEQTALADKKRKATTLDQLGDIRKDIIDFASIFEFFTEDERINKAKELNQLAAQYWEIQLQYIAKIRDLQDTLFGRAMGLREGTKERLGWFGSREDQLRKDIYGTPGTEFVGPAGRLRDATSPEELERVFGEIMDSIAGLLDALVARRGAFLQLWADFTELSGQFGDFNGARTSALERSPMDRFRRGAETMRTDVDAALGMSGDEQVAKLQEIREAARSMYQLQLDLINQIQTNVEEMNRSIDAQKLEIDREDMNPEQLAGSLMDELASLDEQIRNAVDPQQVADLTRRSQELITRWLGGFDKDDPRRAEAVAEAKRLLDQLKEVSTFRYTELLAQIKETSDRYKEQMDRVIGETVEAINSLETEINRLLDMIGELTTQMHALLGAMIQDLVDEADPVIAALGDVAGGLTDVDEALGPMPTALDDVTTAANGAAGALRNLKNDVDAFGEVVRGRGGTGGGNVTAGDRGVSAISIYQTMRQEPRVLLRRVGK